MSRAHTRSRPTRSARPSCSSSSSVPLGYCATTGAFFGRGQARPACAPVAGKVDDCRGARCLSSRTGVPPAPQYNPCAFAKACPPSPLRVKDPYFRSVIERRRVDIAHAIGDVHLAQLFAAVERQRDNGLKRHRQNDALQRQAFLERSFGDVVQSRR